MTAYRTRPIELAAIDQLLSGDGGTVGAPPSCIHVENLCEGGAYLRRLPFRLDIDALDAPLRPAFGPYFANTVSPFDAIRHLAFRDGLVVGQGSVVTSDFRLVSESVYEFIANDMMPDGMADAGAGRVALKTEPSVTVERPTLLLKRPWYPNYGHWLVDSAAMLAIGAGLTMPPGWQIAIGRQEGLAVQRIVRETLDILAPGIDVVELPDDEVWRFSDLHYVTPIHVPLRHMVPAALSALRGLMLRDRLANESPRRGIYVTRGDHGARRLQNEDEVIALCRAFGLDIVQPENLTLMEQARLFRQASLVVGVKGAALTNALFCTGRTHLVVLSPGDFPDPFYWDLTASAGIGYSEIFGVLQGRDRLTGHNAFTISIPSLRATLEACLADLA